MADDILNRGRYNPSLYYDGSVLGATPLNNDNTLEQSSINILLQLIGDIEGSDLSGGVSSVAFINSIGRAIGSMGLLNPIIGLPFGSAYTDTLTTVMGLYRMKGESQAIPSGPATTKIQLDFVPDKGGNLTAPATPMLVTVGVTVYTDITSSGRAALTTQTYYTSGRTIEFYDDLAGQTVTIRYTPTPGNNMYMHNDGFNVIPTLPDIASGIFCKISYVSGVSPSAIYKLDMPAVPYVKYINDYSAATLGSSRVSSFLNLVEQGATSWVPYTLPQFLSSDSMLLGGGFNTFIPSNSIALYYIENANKVTGRIDANFTYSISGTDLLITGDVQAQAILSQLDGSNTPIAAVFAQGEALAQVVAYLKSYLFHHDHGANGGEQISALDLKDIKPASMGSSSLSDTVIPMNITPQYLHRGGHTTTAPYINNNAFTGDLRLGNANGNTVALASATATGIPSTLASLTTGSNLGKFSALDSAGNLKLAIFGNTGDIYQTSNANIFGSGSVRFYNTTTDIYASPSVSNLTVPFISNGLNFINGSTNVFNIGMVSKTFGSISGSASVAMQATGNFNISLTNGKGFGVRSRISNSSDIWNSNILFGRDIIKTPGGVSDYGFMGITTDWGSVPHYYPAMYMGVRYGGLSSTENPYDFAQIKVFTENYTRLYPSNGASDRDSTDAGSQLKKNTGWLFGAGTANSTWVPFIRPISTSMGENESDRDFYFNFNNSNGIGAALDGTDRGSYVFETNVKIGTKSGDSVHLHHAWHAGRVQYRTMVVSNLAIGGIQADDQGLSRGSYVPLGWYFLDDVDVANRRTATASFVVRSSDDTILFTLFNSNFGQSGGIFNGTIGYYLMTI